jgi:hypothetical protein
MVTVRTNRKAYLDQHLLLVGRLLLRLPHERLRMYYS